MTQQVEAQARDGARQAFYRAIAPENLAPLWEVMKNLVPREPRTPCVPVHWRWPELRSRLMEAAGLITAEEAERRVLVLENPGLRGASALTHSLYAGVQLIMPGEIAPDHRHTATAVRLILEGEGGFTSVDDQRAPMQRGDFLITPSWTFHGHGNNGTGPVLWLDGLDVPIVQLFDAAFSEHAAAASAPRESVNRHTGLLMPADYVGGGPNPVFHYPYAVTREQLLRLRQEGSAHPAHGIKLRFSHPGTGGWPTPTIGAFMQLLPAGFAGAAYRCTDAAIYCVVEGSGHSVVGDRSIAWNPNDVFMVPSWTKVNHHASEDAVLFSMSDRPAQQALGLWREQVLPGA